MIPPVTRCTVQGCLCPFYFGNSCSGFGAPLVCDLCHHDEFDHRGDEEEADGIQAVYF